MKTLFYAYFLDFKNVQKHYVFINHIGKLLNDCV